MRIDTATISLEPRTAAGCLDLAVMSYGRHLRSILQLWLPMAVPACFIVYLLSRHFEWGLWWPALVLWFATSIFGVLLGLVAIPAAFGEPFRMTQLFGRLEWPAPLLLLRGLMLRVAEAAGLCLAVVPGILIAVRGGFFVEQAVLQSMERRRHDRRTAVLVREETAELLGRGLAIFLYCLMLGAVLFATLDILMWLLFGEPILLGRLLDAMRAGDAAADELGRLLWRDPLVQTALTAVGLLVYPIGRLAWFFCYVDLRVRRDCWDVELEFVQEARRLRKIQHAN